MRAIVVENPGPESRLRISEVPPPALTPDGVRIAVAATAVNRADLLQRRGLYPPPPGASEILGLECAGTVTELGREVMDFRVGDRVMALLAGGGYAEEVVAPAACTMRVPECLGLEEAAALPETFLTAHLNLFELGGLAPGGTALVHGGGSGVGTSAIQLVKEAGGRIVVTAGSEAKCERCLSLGADRAVNYRSGDFVAEAREETGGEGVDVVLDSIGAPYLERNLAALRIGGRLVVIGLMGGAKAEVHLGVLLSRRLSVIGSTLRSRPVEEKGALVRSFLERFGAALEAGRIRPVVDRVLPLEAADEAHRLLERSEHFGKVVLRVA